MGGTGGIAWGRHAPGTLPFCRPTAPARPGPGNFAAAQADAQTPSGGPKKLIACGHRKATAPCPLLRFSPPPLARTDALAHTHTLFLLTTPTGGGGVSPAIGSPALASRAMPRGRRRCRGAVLLLLLASVLAPLVLYGGSPVSVAPLPDSTVASGAFDREDAPNLVWPQIAASEVSLAKDLTIERLGEHKNRVLSAADHLQAVEAASRSHASGKPDASVLREEPDSRNADEEDAPVIAGNDSARLGRGGMIKEVVGSEGSADGFGETRVGKEVQNREEVGIKLPRSIDAEHKDGSDEAGENIISGMHTVGNLNSSSSEVRFIAEDQSISLCFLEVSLPLIASIHLKMFCCLNSVHSKIRAMEQTLEKVRKIHDSCSGAVNRLRTVLHSTEQQLESNKRQANYLAQVAAKSLPKGLHCLTLRLTNEYYFTNSKNMDFPFVEKLEDPKLYHYALFSDNVLAAAVVVNSTLVHAKKPENHVFHIVTDRLNYAAMKMWFLANPLSKAAIQVQNIEEFTWLNSSYSPVLKQLESRFMIDYYFRSGHARPDENPKFRNPKYLSILNHLRFYLPEIFPKLNKVLFLDDDTVVQRDLTALWLVDLKGKVNGAVETCRETFHRFDKYLNFSNPLIAKNFDPHACGWAYGMNMFDLSEWRKQNITEVYHTWQKLNENRLLWKLGTLPAGLVTFWNRTFPLDHSWHQLGLGYNPNVNEKGIRRAAVIHYNGNLKPWLEIGLAKYRKYWSAHVNFDQVFLRECNINP
ncbi:putative galacturonosyltransferase 4 [Dichanthelium oligosanthes]|uniref:Putative galacturonosyltransferase 4 n=1 Tax=Dichanthelium oligosanthes TaxID=888268 RepID=A0A1E5WIZ0_9POAL|nr:putative galacturonosyltransferase 4 [Dichanthelium oligosanthes]